MCDPGDDDVEDAGETPTADEGPTAGEATATDEAAATDEATAAEDVDDEHADSAPVAPDTADAKMDSPAPAEPPEAPRPRRLSNRDRQAEIRELDALAKSLVALPQSKLEALDLDDLTAVIAAARTKKKGARVRELRRIATALRQRDPEVVEQRLKELEAPARAEVERLKACEVWRDRLLEGGDAVLSELVDAHPQADRQRLRQLVRTASKDRTHAKSQHAYRELFREIRSLTQAQ